VDADADLGRINEGEPHQMRQHPVVGLGHEGGNDAHPAARGVSVGQLVAEGGLARARGAGYQVGATDRQPAAQDLIKPRDAGRTLGQSGWSAVGTVNWGLR
jgi:hypothetical protein